MPLGIPRRTYGVSIEGFTGGGGLKKYYKNLGGKMRRAGMDLTQVPEPFG